MADPLFMLDSNICIYILADKDCLPAVRLQQYEPGQAVISAISYAEIVRGMTGDRSCDVQQFDRFVEMVPVEPFDVRAALNYRSIPFRRGKFDRLIAAHALALDATLITNNEADFVDIPDLKVENWMQ